MTRRDGSTDRGGVPMCRLARQASSTSVLSAHDAQPESRADRSTIGQDEPTRDVREGQTGSRQASRFHYL